MRRWNSHPGLQCDLSLASARAPVKQGPPPPAAPSPQYRLMESPGNPKGPSKAKISVASTSPATNRAIRSAALAAASPSPEALVDPHPAGVIGQGLPGTSQGGHHIPGLQSLLQWFLYKQVRPDAAPQRGAPQVRPVDPPQAKGAAWLHPFNTQKRRGARWQPPCHCP
jgi:hypothetical protein